LSNDAAEEEAEPLLCFCAQRRDHLLVLLVGDDWSGSSDTSPGENQRTQGHRPSLALVRACASKARIGAAIAPRRIGRPAASSGVAPSNYRIIARLPSD
jgi:hypothetical protein